MKQPLFIFSDTVIKRKNNTLFFDIVKRENHLDFEIKREEFLFHKEIFTPTGDKKYMPVENIDSISVFGATNLNSRLIYFLSRNTIPVYFFSETGRFQGAFYTTGKRNSSKLLLAQAQARLDEEKRLAIAREITTSSIKNILFVLRKYYKRGCKVKENIEAITNEQCSIIEAETIDELLGVEGNSRREYYSAWKKIFSRKTGFEKRNNRPATDYINSMISFGNALLYSTIANSIYQTKLYPELGFIHSASDNKFSLAFDFADIYKPLIVDKLIFRLVNKKMISKDDFIKIDKQCRFKDESKKMFVEEFRKQLEMKTPSNKIKVNYRNIIRKDLFELIKYLLGNKDELQFFKATK